MVVAVVVDQFAESRAKDFSSVATELEFEEVQEKNLLHQMFTQIDEDRSGALSMDEITSGACKIQTFRDYLRVLDIDEADLQQLFFIVDRDDSGEIDADEFIEALYRMKHTESKTATKFVKHMVTELSHRQQVANDLNQNINGIQGEVLDRLHDIEQKLDQDLNGAGQPDDFMQLLQRHQDAIDETIASGVQKATSVALAAAMNSAVSDASRAAIRVSASSSQKAASISKSLQMRLQHQMTGSQDDASSSDSNSSSRRSPLSLPTSLHLRKLFWREAPSLVHVGQALSAKRDAKRFDFPPSPSGASCRERSPRSDSTVTNMCWRVELGEDVGKVNEQLMVATAVDNGPGSGSDGTQSVNRGAQSPRGFAEKLPSGRALL